MLGLASHLPSQPAAQPSRAKHSDPMLATPRINYNIIKQADAELKTKPASTGHTYNKLRERCRPVASSPSTPANTLNLWCLGQKRPPRALRHNTRWLTRDSAPISTPTQRHQRGHLKPFLDQSNYCSARALLGQSLPRIYRNGSSAPSEEPFAMAVLLLMPTWVGSLPISLLKWRALHYHAT